MKTDDNAVASIDNITCPRVYMRIACDTCGYPLTEAKYDIDDEELHGVYIPCKHELLKNAVETDKENPKFIRTPVTYGDCNNKTCVCYNQKHLDRYGKGSRVVECDQHSVLIQRGL